MSTVQVTFDVTHPETHLVRVTQHFPAKPGAIRRLRMPAWVPGSYKIRDFGRNVQDLTATVGGKKVTVRQPTKDEWIIACDGKAIDVTFDVYGRELTVDTSHVTGDHAHLFPATLLLYDDLSRNDPHKVRIKAPRGWKVYSGLETKALNGTLDVAVDYDHLIDCPMEVGPPENYHIGRFTVRGRKHRHIVWRAPTGVDWKRIESDMRKLCKETIRIFGEAPYPHYTFLTHVAADHGGGLEHRTSTVLGAEPAHLLSDEKIQTRYLPLVAHEFFHTWNVKRILPAAFQPYDLQREVYTDLLWLFEGFTSYFELPILYRSKVIGDESFAKMMGEDLDMYRKALGRKRITVSQASRLTWTLLYQPHEHNVNRNVSYYSKGMWVGLCLDAELRRRGVKDGLDAVMRHAWRKHGRTGMGVTDDAFPDLVEQATGKNLRAKINAWTHGTEELPIERSLKFLGWDVKAEWKDPKKNKGLGVEFKPGTSTIARIWENVPAYKILQPDDEISAAHGYKWKPDTFSEQVTSMKVGDSVGVAVFREGRLRVFKVPLTELPKDKFVITQRKKDAAGVRRRKAWIGAGRIAKKKRKGEAKRTVKRTTKRATETRPASKRNVPPRRRIA